LASKEADPLSILIPDAASVRGMAAGPSAPRPRHHGTRELFRSA
jgi:hypothetical protein